MSWKEEWKERHKEQKRKVLSFNNRDKEASARKMMNEANKRAKAEELENLRDDDT